MKRGGQIAVFAAIGVALLIIIAIILVVLAGQRRSTEAREQAGSVLDANAQAALSGYLGSCLDTIMTDALDKFSSQGAVIYKNQDGLVSETDRELVSVSGLGAHIHYGLKRNSDVAPNGKLLPFYYPPPRYPDESLNLSEIKTKYLKNSQRLAYDAFQEGYFGDILFPATCMANGPNKRGTGFACNNYPRPLDRTPSMQEQLAKYVASRAQTCADLTVFQEAFGKEITQVDAVNATVLFGQEGTLVTLQMPLTVSGGKSEAKIANFTRTYDVRLRAIGEFINELLLYESRDPAFNISDPLAYEKLASFKDGLRVDRTKRVATNPVANPAADLVIVTDTKSIMRGKSYTMQFLVQHRSPMLEPLTPAQVDAVKRMIGCNIPRRCVFSAADPDDERVTVNHNPMTLRSLKCGQPINITVVDTDGSWDWETIAPEGGILPPDQWYERPRSGPNAGKCTRIGTSLPRCGDGKINTGEECDDGNTASGDGCSDICKFENACPGQQDIISDTTATVDGHAAALAYDQNSAWIHVPGAHWIWSTNKVLDSTVDTTKTFAKAFTLADITGIHGAIDIAADNNYDCTFNNAPLGSGTDQFWSIYTYPIENSQLRTGTNTISCTVMNQGLPDTTPESNPAGLIFKMSLAQCGGTGSATCTDNKQNQDETGVDCGGSCPACPGGDHCTNNAQDADEEGIDCGGSCPACTNGGCGEEGESCTSKCDCKVGYDCEGGTCKNKYCESGHCVCPAVDQTITCPNGFICKQPPSQGKICVEDPSEVCGSCAD